MFIIHAGSGEDLWLRWVHFYGSLYSELGCVLQYIPSYFQPVMTERSCVWRLTLRRTLLFTLDYHQTYHITMDGISTAAQTSAMLMRSTAGRPGKTPVYKEQKLERPHLGYRITCELIAQIRRI